MKLHQSIVFALLVTTLWSCKKRDLTYQGQTLVEFSNPISGRNEKTTGPSIGGTSVLGDNPNIPIRGDRDSLIVQLIGPHRNAPVEVSYTVQAGTAVEGVDFEIIGTKGKVVIPANSSSAAIHLQLKNSSTTPSNVKRVTFTLSGTNQGEVGLSANYVSYVVNIYPMKAHLNKELSTPSGAKGSYLASSTGQVFTTVAGNAASIDIAYDFVTRVSGGTTTTVPVFISPRSLSGDATASATKYSTRVFTPPASVPSHLQASYATTQLGTLTATNVNAIPVTGTAAGAAVNDSVDIVENGIYTFVNGNGKKGYLRVKQIVTGASGSVKFDVMAQP